MTRLAVVSDLHFGTIPEGLETILAGALNAAAPDLVVVAGDLTQRARAHQFAAARGWLDALDSAWMAVPGNHDVPAYNLAERFGTPFARYRAAIDADLSKVAALEGLTVAGLNTVRSWQPHRRWQEGKVRSKSLNAIRTQLGTRHPEADRTVVVVSHHILHPVPDNDRAHVARSGPRALTVLQAVGAQVLVSGHTHRHFAMTVPVDLPDGTSRKLLSVGAPTAMSDRTRGEANGFWLIDFETPDRFALSLDAFDGARYAPARRLTWKIGGDPVDRPPGGKE